MVDPHNMPEPDLIRIKEISEDITKSMLDRSYPAVDATHYFMKYADGKTTYPQFMHSIAMMYKGGIIRLDKTEKPFSITFVLLENGKPKMHHMIDDEYTSETFGCFMNDPYEGPKKRQTCYRHLKEGYTASCDKCELEKNTQICMMHNNVLSECVNRKKYRQLLKAVTPKEKAPELITGILKKYIDENWSFEK